MVDVETHLIVAYHVSQHPNDKQEMQAALDQIAALPDILGKAENMLANTGDFSELNVDLRQKSEIKALILEKRGLNAGQGEWSWVCIGWNFKR